MKHVFPTSTKVNTDPAWTLADYAEKNGMTRGALQGLRSRNSDFPEPKSIAKHKRFKGGKQLFSVRELDAWMSKYKESKNGS